MATRPGDIERLAIVGERIGQHAALGQCIADPLVRARQIELPVGAGRVAAGDALEQVEGRPVARSALRERALIEPDIADPAVRDREIALPGRPVGRLPVASSLNWARASSARCKARPVWPSW